MKYFYSKIAPAKPGEVYKAASAHKCFVHKTPAQSIYSIEEANPGCARRRSYFICSACLLYVSVGCNKTDTEFFFSVKQAQAKSIWHSKHNLDDAKNRRVPTSTSDTTYFVFLQTCPQKHINQMIGGIIWLEKFGYIPAFFLNLQQF